MTKSLFDQQAEQYAAFRPTYPKSLYRHINQLTQTHDLAIDAATGNGQAAQHLAAHFDRVIAFDISRAQLALAHPLPNVDYKLADANNIPAPDHCADLITVATAVHWFDLDAFYSEVRRVAKTNGILCVWSYGGSTLNNEPLNELIQYYAQEIIGPFWSTANLDYVAQQYTTLPFPFTTIASPTFHIQQSVTQKQYLGYLRSWSATQKYIDTHGHNPLDALQNDFEKHWGSPTTEYTWSMPVFMKTGLVHE